MFQKTDAINDFKPVSVLFGGFPCCEFGVDVNLESLLIILEFVLVLLVLLKKAGMLSI